MTTNPEFSKRLRQLRTTHDLTQEGLADLVGCAPETIRSFENGRRRPSRAIAQRMAEVLRLDPEVSEEFIRLARTAPESTQLAEADERSPLPVSANRALPLPADVLIGRRPEIEYIQRVLLDEKRRLVTLLGPGGVGKTRLALQIAANLGPGFADGVVFVALAAVNDPVQAVSTIAEALGCVLPAHEQPSNTLISYLSSRQLLLILDNLEHLLSTAHAEQLVGLVARIVREAPGVQLLVTSRERLQLQAEWVVELGGLGLPRGNTAAEIARSDAVLLFVERASRTSGAFTLTAANQASVAQICRRLEGLPLAIELAAAQVSFLPPDALLERLDQALTVLEGGARDLPERQRTMRATIDWSYNLLDEQERLFLQRLAVFMAGFTLEASEAIGTGGPIQRSQSLRLLSRLVNQSLVLRDDNGQGTARYRLLEPVRQYALERLEEQPAEANATSERHGAYFVTLAKTTAPLLRTAAQVRLVEQLELDYANISAAMLWLIAQGELATAASFGRDLWLFLWLRGHFREGLRWAAAILARLPATPSPARAAALLTTSILAYGQADYEQAMPFAEQALATFDALDDTWGRVESISMVGLIAAGLKQDERAEQVMEQAVAESLVVGNRWSAAMTLTYWAPIPLNKGQYRRAAELAEQARSLARELGDRIAEYSANYNLALVAQAEGDPSSAQGLFVDALKLALEIGDMGNSVACLKGLGGVAVAQQDFERAARLWGAAAALDANSEVAQYAYTLDKSLYEQMLARARAGLDPARWAQAWEAGRAMNLQQAVNFALG